MYFCCNASPSLFACRSSSTTSPSNASASASSPLTRGACDASPAAAPAPAAPAAPPRGLPPSDLGPNIPAGDAPPAWRESTLSPLRREGLMPPAAASGAAGGSLAATLCFLGGGVKNAASARDCLAFSALFACVRGSGANSASGVQPGAAQHGEQQLRAVRRAPTFSAATLACSRSFLSCSSAAFAARSATVYCLFFAPFGRPMATHSPACAVCGNSGATRPRRSRVGHSRLLSAPTTYRAACRQRAARRSPPDAAHARAQQHHWQPTLGNPDLSPQPGSNI